ncbi:MAG: hypothetical protein RIR10_1654, partial [Planctomycetota bacterium]
SRRASAFKRAAAGRKTSARSACVSAPQPRCASRDWCTSLGIASTGVIGTLPTASPVAGSNDTSCSGFAGGTLEADDGSMGGAYRSRRRVLRVLAHRLQPQRILGHQSSRSFNLGVERFALFGYSSRPSRDGPSRTAHTRWPRMEHQSGLAGAPALEERPRAGISVDDQSFESRPRRGRARHGGGRGVECHRSPAFAMDRQSLNERKCLRTV